jgi:hypothetical protein
MASIHAIATWFNARRRVVAYALLGWVALIVVGAGRPPAANEWFVVPDLGSVLPAILGALAVIELVLIAYVRPNRYRARRVSRQGLSLLSLLFITTVVVLVALAIGPQEAPEEPILSELPTASNLGPAIDAATQQLRMGPEPRMAVMAAYASHERALAELGHDRHPADTPTEHLAKALAAVPTVAAPSVRLGHLYELARFSAEPITENDRIRAAESLAEARRTLAASTSGTP